DAALPRYKPLLFDSGWYEYKLPEPSAPAPPSNPASGPTTAKMYTSGLFVGDSDTNPDGSELWQKNSNRGDEMPSGLSRIASTFLYGRQHSGGDGSQKKDSDTASTRNLKVERLD